MNLGFLVLMFLLGAVMGSFVACQAWRMRYREQKRKSPGKRSVCLKCGHKLKLYENIPIFSWIALRGKCAKCGRKIGAMEILAEVLMGAAFLGVGWKMGDVSALGVMGWIEFVLMLVLVVGLGFLAIYDGMWGELPTTMLWGVGTVSGVLCIVNLWQENLALERIWNLLGAIGILAVVYLILYLVSRGKWVGNGDWILGLILALVISDAWLALIVLCIANFLGCVVSWPKVRGKKQKKVYFGPFMVIAFVVVWVFSDYLMLMVK